MDDPGVDLQVMGLPDLIMDHLDTIPLDIFHHSDITRPLVMVLLGTILLSDTDHLDLAIVVGFTGPLGQDTEVDLDTGHQDSEVVPHTEVELSEGIPAGLLKDQGLDLQ